MDIATLGLKIDATGAIRGVGEVDAKLKSLETSAAKFGGVLKTAFFAGGAAVAGLSALIIKNTAEMDKATAQLDATLKSTKGAAGQTRDALIEAAAGFQRLSTFGDDAVMSAQALLLTFTNIKGDQFNAATQAILDMATAMGGDLKGATIQVGKALNDPILGVSALAKAGVQLTESQKALVEQMVNVGDVAGAQKIILGELATQFGGSAKAARDTMGGALTALKNAFGDLLEVPGIIQPIIISLNRLTAALSNPEMVNAIKVFVSDSIFLLGAFIQAIQEVSATVIDFVGGIARTFGKLSPSNSPLNLAADAADKWRNALIGSSTMIAALTDSIAEFVPTQSKGATSTAQSAAALGSFGDAAQSAAVAVTKLTNEQENLYSWIRKLEKTGTIAPLQQVALPESSPVAVAALPPEGAQSAWTDFWGWLATEGGVTAKGIGDSLANTFTNIVQRGKASFGDLFSFLGGTGLGGKTGGVVLGFAANLAEMMLGGKARAKAAREAFAAEVNAIGDTIASLAASFGASMGAFTSDLARAGQTFEEVSERIGDLLTITAKRALGNAGGDVGAAITGLEQSNRNGVNNVAIEQLKAYRKATDDLTASYKVATDAAKAAQERRRADAKEDNEIRRLRATGQNEAADRLALEKRFREEIANALKEGLDLISLMAAQSAEWAQFIEDGIKAQEEAARQRLYTIRSLDADIAAAAGDTAGADAMRRQLDRDKILADVTDEVIRAKYEELWALEDVNRAAKDAADALDALQELTWTLADLDAQIAEAKGNAGEAAQIRRDIDRQKILADVTDETVRAKWEELWAIQDANRALDELAAAAKAAQEAAWESASLDAQIAAAKGNLDEADAIETRIRREQILADVTDEAIRLKWEELWALQDAAKAAKEAADALELLQKQTEIGEDYEVRRLVAMGKTTEAEELRFKLTQQRELLQAQKDLALGLITQELYDQLLELLGLEATAFADANAQAAASPLAASITDTGRQQGGTLGSFAAAQVQDIDRVVGELTTIRIRMGQLVQLMTRFTRGGGVVGAVNDSLQTDTNYQQIVSGNLVTS